MPGIRPFDGYLVTPGRAREVVSPAYDSVLPAERRRYAEAHPDNFLNTMRLVEDYPPDAPPTEEQLLATNRANLERLLADGSFAALGSPCMFLYQLQSGDHVQTGVVCEVGVAEYETGRLRKHENTRSDKEDLLTRYQVTVGVSSSPICLTYACDPDIDACVAGWLSAPPDLAFTAEDGVAQKIWRIDEPDRQAELARLFARVDITYLTDGHHRAASGQRYAAHMRTQHGNTGAEPYNQLLVALFPDNQLNLLPFHRCVRDTNGLAPGELLDRLAADFTVSATGDGDCIPRGAGEFGMLLDGRSYRLAVQAGRVDHDDPVAALDVVLLQERILAPHLGIRDMRGDPRLDYVAGTAGIEGVRNKCREGWAVAFLCHATSIAQLMRVADAGALMPPKSTYFDPKPRSGIFVRPR